MGSDDTLAIFNRGDRPQILRGYPVFIASETRNHFDDFVDCLNHDPSAVYIEKGFCSQQEKNQARELAGDIPVYFLSQYRFSKVFDKFLMYNETICGIKYTWQVELHSAQEWLYHIVSLDNYIKNSSNSFYVKDYGTYEIDSISQFSILKSPTRSCKIEIETTNINYEIELGKNNRLYYSTPKDFHYMIDETNEDCLGAEITSILNGNKEKLERL